MTSAYATHKSGVRTYDIAESQLFSGTDFLSSFSCRVAGLAACAGRSQVSLGGENLNLERQSSDGADVRVAESEVFFGCLFHLRWFLLFVFWLAANL